MDSYQKMIVDALAEVNFINFLLTQTQQLSHQHLIYFANALGYVLYYLKDYYENSIKDWQKGLVKILYDVFD